MSGGGGIILGTEPLINWGKGWLEVDFNLVDKNNQPELQVIINKYNANTPLTQGETDFALECAIQIARSLYDQAT